MHYLLMLYVDETGWTKLSKAQQEQGAAAYTAYTQALKKAGALAKIAKSNEQTVETGKSPS